MTSGVGDITTFSDWLLSPFNFLMGATGTAVGNATIGTPLQNLSLNSPTDPYSNGIIDTTLNDLSYFGGNSISTLLGENITPVLNANYAFSNVTKAVPGPPVIDSSSGNLVVPPVDLTSILGSGFDNSAGYQLNNPIAVGSSDASFSNSGGTPQVSSTIFVWIALGIGAYLIFKN